MCSFAALLVADVAFPLSSQVVTACVDAAGHPPLGGRTVNAGDFSLRVPALDTALRVPRFDSQGGGWGRDGVRLTYDYGSYSNTLDSLPNLTNLRRSYLSLGNHAAVLITAVDSANGLVVAAHWRDLRPSSTGPVSLTLYGTAADTTRRRDLLTMICSVQFKF
jgi:hypothetical protein